MIGEWNPLIKIAPVYSKIQRSKCAEQPKQQIYIHTYAFATHFLAPTHNVCSFIKNHAWNEYEPLTNTGNRLACCSKTTVERKKNTLRGTEDRERKNKKLFDHCRLWYFQHPVATVSLKCGPRIYLRFNTYVYLRILPLQISKEIKITTSFVRATNLPPVSHTISRSRIDKQQKKSTAASTPNFPKRRSFRNIFRDRSSEFDLQ